jgi:hypothetical protein
MAPTLEVDSDNPTTSSTPVKSKIPSINPWKIKDWKDGKHSGPTVDAFYLQLEGKGIWTTWNKRATEVFVDHFISTLEVAEEKNKFKPVLVEQAFRAHLPNLKAKYKLQNPGTAPEKKAQDHYERQLARRKRVS